MNSPRIPRPRSGFTLIELLTVIAIIGILAAIIIPVVGKVRATARQSQCLSNTRQLAFAMQAYAQDNKLRLPATVETNGTQWNRSDGKVWQYVQNTAPVGSDWERAPGSVFNCPSAKDANQQYNTYGKNSSLGPRTEWSQDKKSVETPLSSISEPTKAVLVMDFSRPNLTSTLFNTQARKDETSLRHESRFNIAYVAGNVGTMTRSELELLQSDFSDARIRFWSGN